MGSLEGSEWEHGGNLRDSTTTPNARTSAAHGRMPVILLLETFAHRKPEDV
jgi:hypothetical protein